jgi:hypothetical protein
MAAGLMRSSPAAPSIAVWCDTALTAAPAQTSRWSASSNRRPSALSMSQALAAGRADAFDSVRGIPASSRLSRGCERVPSPRIGALGTTSFAAFFDGKFGKTDGKFRLLVISDGESGQPAAQKWILFSIKSKRQNSLAYLCARSNGTV